MEDKALTASDEAADELADVNGGTNLIRSSELSRGTVGTVGDVLKFQPGIYAQSVNGGEATRLSIRGSGIVRSGFLFGFGTVLLLDGQRLYGASGNPYEAIEPLAIDHVEVLRGSNAFEYGPLSLGGAINYVTKTGYDASPFQARFELGSYGYTREQLSSGAVIGNADYYVSFTRFDKRGFRQNTDSFSSRVVGNIGYRFNPKVSTRFHYRFVEQDQEDAGFLTWAQLKANPRQSQFGLAQRDRLNPGTLVLGNTTNLQVDQNASLEIGAQYDSSPINSPHGVPVAVYFDFTQIAGSLRYKRSDKVLGRQSNTLASFIAHQTLNNRWKSQDVATGKVVAIRTARQNDWTILATNETEVVDHLWLELGAAGIFQHRETNITEGVALVGGGIRKDFRNFAPKAGLAYQFTERSRVFANVSRSIDTPSSNSFIRVDPLYVPQEFLRLKPAKATTVEIGTRGEESIVGWNLSVYRSWINDELLTVQIAPGVVTSSNATRTIHQGLEAGLDVALWQYRRAGATPDALPEHQILLRQSYTLNDFRFQGDPLFHTNQLAGVPVHLYNAELGYEHGAGFYAGVNATTSLTKYPVDFKNTITNRPYAAFGAKLGFQQPKKGLEIFVEGRNLTNRNYAPAVAPIYNAAGKDSNVYAPVEGRAINAGAAYSF